MGFFKVLLRYHLKGIIKSVLSKFTKPLLMTTDTLESKIKYLLETRWRIFRLFRVLQSCSSQQYRRQGRMLLQHRRLPEVSGESVQYAQSRLKPILILSQYSTILLQVMHKIIPM